MDLAITGKHALLFDDDATSTFINSDDALVPCITDNSLLIDRHDVRHLLDRIPPRPPLRSRPLVQPELDAERYLDLPNDVIQHQQESLTDAMKQPEGGYQAVPFSYENARSSEEPKNSDSNPPTEKLHQIIARTAMFVSDHGGQSEIVLRVKQGDNPTFGFLMPGHHLHVYYRFLVDNSHLLRPIGDKAKEQEKFKSVDSVDQLRYASGEALSLLGSMYGEDDDDSHQANLKAPDSNSTSAATDKPEASKDVAIDPSVSKALKDEGSKFPSSSSYIPKEKLATIKRNLSVSSTLSSAARSKKTEDASGSLSGVLKKPGSSYSSQSDLKAVILEPPSFLKRTIDKIVDLIIKHGMDFESVLAEQDKSTGRFPFLVPSNLYHSYYLKVLQDAREVNAESKKKLSLNSCKESAHRVSLSELSKGCSLDSQKKEKLKMVIGDSEKSMNDRDPVARQSGLRADEAAAVVLAATRGASPANAAAHAPAARKMSADEAAAIVLTATRGVSPANAAAQHLSICRPSISTGSFSLKGPGSATKPTASSDSSFPLRLSTQNSKKESSIMTDDEWIKKAIAKTAALAAASEVDSSEASLTREQKQKAERLKRAKLFASMIKNGSLVSKSASPDTALTGNIDISGAGSARSGAESDTVAKEREGSSVPFGTESSDKIMSGESDCEEVEHERKHSSKKHSSRHRHHRHDVDHNGYRKHSRKRRGFESDASPTSIQVNEKRRKDCSSKDEKSKRHRHYSSSDDEHWHRKRHRHYSSSDDEHRHKRSYRSRHNHKFKEALEDENQKKQADRHLETRRNEDSKRSLDAANAKNGEVGTSDGASEVPSDLRAKIRAMLLETM